MQIFKENFNLTKQLFIGNSIPLSKTAILWNDLEIIREQLFENCIKTADYLLKIGLKENDKLVLSLNDSPAIHEFFLGAIAVGIIPILVNPKLKEEELIYILNDSKAVALVLEIKTLAEIESIYKKTTTINSRNNIIVQDTYVQDIILLENNKEYFYPRASKMVYIEEEDLEMRFVEKPKDAPAFGNILRVLLECQKLLFIPKNLC